MSTYLKYIVLILAVLIVAFALSVQAQWEYLGLGEYSTRLVKYHNGNIYVGTDNGIYCKSAASADTLWIHLGLDSKTIEALLIISDDSLLAAVDITQVGEDTVSIFRSIDSGQSWQPFQNGFGGGYYNVVFAFDMDLTYHSVIYAAGVAVVAKSVDGGQSWVPVDGCWQCMGMGSHFVRVDSNSSNIIWAGGESAIFAPVLLKSEFYGDWGTWLSAYLPYTGDNACHDIAIDPNNSDICYVGMEGRVARTTNGIDYTNIDGPYYRHYVYGVESDPVNSDIVYASGAVSYEPPPLTLFKSTDSGLTWGGITGPDVQFGAMDLLLLRNGPNNELYMPTYATGVYRYTDIFDPVCGDVNNDGWINILDITFLIAYLYQGGPAPIPPEIADVNSSGEINILDITYLISNLYMGGPEPICPM
jgi:hypothetical protein